METSFTLMLWRASLEAAPAVPEARDLSDWADLLRGAGEDAAAEVLVDVSAIRQGFSFQALADQRRCGSPALPGEESRPPGSEWTIHKGVAELEELATAFSPTLIAPGRPNVSGHPNNEDGIGIMVPAGRYPVDIAAGAARLRAFLTDPAPTEEAAAEAECQLAQFLEADRRLPALDYRALRDAPLDRLVAGIALTGLIDFALNASDLLMGPTGSILFLHTVARLDQEGLGPYFSAVPRLVRESRDLFNLAARVAVDRNDALEAWIVLLSRKCRGPLLCEIVDELGDRGLSQMLGAILDRTVSRPVACIDREMVVRIRDAALDNADWVLAARAQTCLARLQADAPGELALLGAIHATIGDFGAAEAAYRQALDQIPKDLELRAKLHAVRRNDASELIVSYGLLSHLSRQRLRLERRGIAPRHGPRKGERINAVDLS